VVHQNVLLSEDIAIHILDSLSDSLPATCSILDGVKSRVALEPVEKLTDWELFRSLASEFISPNIQIHSSNEVDKAALEFAAYAASAYRISTR
jgi:hypothetical protein